MSETLGVDIVVLGGGMAGHSAAGHAASLGARVVLIEKSPQVGGSAVLSGTSLWTVPTLEVLRERVPDGDPELGRHLVATYPKAVAWMRSAGVKFSAPRWVLRYGRGYRFDVVDYFERCAAIIKKAGGWVVTGTVAERLVLRDGRVRGVLARSGDATLEIESPRGVILGTGGWQANRALLRKHFGENGDRILIRSNPHSSGDGLALALAAGATTAGDMRTFYGHLMMSPIEGFAREHFTRLGTWFSEEGVLLNVAGERFTDESRGDHENAQATAREAQAKALLVLDEFIVQNMQMSGNTVSAGIAEARASGVHLAVADTLEDLGRLVEPWGFAGARLPAAVGAYNAYLRGEGSATVPRRWARNLLADPPYYALEVQPGITFTQGGLRVDTAARVLGADGRPIRGLCAAGADIGGIYNGGYAGGLALACVFGITAAQTLLADADGERTPGAA